jgi:hypothetical protein
VNNRPKSSINCARFEEAFYEAQGKVEDLSGTTSRMPLMIVTVVIPTFNEDGNVGRLIHETCRVNRPERRYQDRRLQNRNTGLSVAEGALNERRG